MSDAAGEPRGARIRERGALVLVALGALLAVLASIALYARAEILVADDFAARTSDALEEPELREAIGRTLAAEVAERAPETLSAQPLVESALASLAGTDLFRSVFRSAVERGHRALVSDTARPLVLTLDDVSTVLRSGLAGIDPRIAEELPERIAPALTRVRSSEAARELARSADRLGALAIVLPAVAAAALAVALVLARRRRVLVTGLASLACSAALGIGLLAIAERVVVADAGSSDVLTEDAARDAIDAIWSSLFGDLVTALSIAAAVALVACVLAAGLLGGPLASPGARWRLVVGAGSLPGRLARGAALVVAGALIVVEPQAGVPIAAALAGALIVLAGLWELAAARRPARTQARPSAPGPAQTAPAGEAGAAFLGGRWRVAAIAGLVLAGVATGAAAVLVLDRDPVAPEPASEPIAPERIAVCNGLATNCDRGLGEVVFAGTHNSMSAAEDPGWYFANQRFDIGRQLADGIRMLMIDPHWGVADAEGNIRTDLEAEGTDRNRVARLLGPEAVAAAERLIGEVGLGTLEGERRPYLCHTLCELGATEMTSALGELRAFLDRERYEVVVILVESSIPAGDVAASFEAAGLLPYLATLDPEEPLPDLRAMIAANRRLVVLTDHDPGEPDWYMDVHSFVQDTAVTADADSCEARIGKGTSPLFLINHWVEEFPPSRSENAALSDEAALLERAARCARELGRRPGLIAVDHYDATGVAAAAEELNGG